MCWVIISEQRLSKYVAPRHYLVLICHFHTQNRTAYNAQTVVGSAKQVIVAAGVTTVATDAQQLLPMIEQAEYNLSQKIN